MTKPVLHTILCDMLDIEYPVLLAGMGPTVGGGQAGVAGPELAAAVSNAGGLGVLGAAGFPPDRLEQAITRIQDLTDRPFGVDILLPSNVAPRPAREEKRERPSDPRELLPADHRAAIGGIRESLELPDVQAPRADVRTPRFTPQDQVDVITGLQVPVLAAGLGNPAPYVDQVHEAGGQGDLAGRQRQERQARGRRRRRHRGRAGPRGGRAHRADRHDGAAAAGARRGRARARGGGRRDRRRPRPRRRSGDGLRRRLVRYRLHPRPRRPTSTSSASAAFSPPRDEDTRVTRLYSGKTMRNIANELIEAWEDSGTEALPMGLQGLLIADIAEAAKQGGREDLLMNAAGQISGLLEEIRPAADVLQEMVAEAANIFTSRLPANVRAGAAA